MVAKECRSHREQEAEEGQEKDGKRALSENRMEQILYLEKLVKTFSKYLEKTKKVLE